MIRDDGIAGIAADPGLNQTAVIASRDYREALRQAASGPDSSAGAIADRLMIVKQYAIAFKPTHLADPTPFVAACPTCGAQMQLVMRLWTASRAFLDTG